MIDQLKLTNFRRHESLTIDFTMGLNALKGANEAGKSTIGEAIAYSFFGARALRESLAETVTWGQPESSLRVVNNFTFDGVAYNLYRAKSGCELSWDGGKVTGQADVTKYIETLFGVNADTAGRLMLAEQNALRSSLTAGPAATVQLIETLAGFSLMDDIVAKIQDQLPCGSTTSAQERLTAAHARVEALNVPLAEPTLDSGPAERLEGLQLAAAAADDLLSKFDVPAATAAIRAAEAAAVRRTSAAEALEKVQVQLRAVPVEPATSEAQVDLWKQALVDRIGQKRLWDAYNTPVPTCTDEWEGDRKSFDDFVRSAQAQAVANRATLAQLVSDRREALTLKINEDSCAFCKKPLADVPEVIARNAAQDAKIVALTAQITELEQALAADELEWQACTRLMQTTAAIERAFPAAYWTLQDTVPPTPAWTGEVPSNPDSGEDFAALARQGEQAWRAHRADLTRWEGLGEEQKRLQAALDLPVADVAAEQQVLVDAKTAAQALQEARTALTTGQHEVEMAESAYRTARAIYEHALKDRMTAAQTVTDMQAELTTMTIHNDLIRKIRAARPVVAATLWGSVLAAISHYFSEVRGEPSTVTRSPQGFKVNGRGVAGLSGSTLDALGLALRLAVTKTFLPNIDFLLLDEPASGMESVRETNMLGVIATCGFPQVLLISHSELCDSFAANLVQL